jgi:hypothetical protein
MTYGVDGETKLSIEKLSDIAGPCQAHQVHDSQRLVSISVSSFTAGHAFANALGGLTLMHEPATGTLRRQSVWRKMLG